MTRPLFETLALWGLGFSAWHKPSLCPFCPGNDVVHWIGWGSYERYASDSEDPNKRIAVARCRCKLARRTFSLLPDSLLPYHGWRTTHILQALHNIFAVGVPVSALARHANVARTTLRSLKARFLRTLPILRLPGREGALDAPVFLRALADMGPAAVADLFRGWKEREPKLSIVGIYRRC